MLLGDRNLEFHSQYGRHHRMRVPKCRAAQRSGSLEPEKRSLMGPGGFVGSKINDQKYDGLSLIHSSY